MRKQLLNFTEHKQAFDVAEGAGAPRHLPDGRSGRPRRRRLHLRDLPQDGGQGELPPRLSPARGRRGGTYTRPTNFHASQEASRRIEGFLGGFSKSM